MAVTAVFRVALEEIRAAISDFLLRTGAGLRGLQELFYSFQIGESSETQTLAQSLLALQLRYVDVKGMNSTCCLSIEIT